MNQLYYDKVIEIEKEMSFLPYNSLLGGNGGIALFYIYLYKATGNENFYDKASDIIEREIEKMAEGNNRYDFGSGDTGFLWMLLHCKNENLISLPDGFIEEDMIDMIKSYSISYLKEGYFDYFYGGLSACMFALEDGSDESKDFLKSVIYLLEDISIKEENGRYWPGTFFTKKDEPNKEINFGLAHGIPSIISILSKINEIGIEQEKCTQLLTEAITYLYANKFSNKISLFPSAIKKGIETPNSRLAWCYGDLGIAMSIWQAGKSTKNKEWQNEALEIMEHASQRRKPVSSIVKDACICHGSAGIGLIFYRFYIETSLEQYKESAYYWFDETLKMAKHSDGVAGFKNWTPDRGLINNIGLLEGTSGIGLALISAAFETHPNWDRCLLLS